MPSRPNKKPKPQPASPTGATDGGGPRNKHSQQQHRDQQTKAILGKFQGRKSI